MNITIHQFHQLVETIVDFSQKLNIKTIAEYVHNKDVFQNVLEMSINFSQGYYIGKPEQKIQEQKSRVSLIEI